MCGAVVLVIVRRAVRELAHVRLADEDCSGAAKTSDDGRVFDRNEVREDFRTGGRPDAGGPDVVFERNGNTVQRASVAAACDLRFGACGGLARASGVNGQ